MGHPRQQGDNGIIEVMLLLPREVLECFGFRIDAESLVGHEDRIAVSAVNDLVAGLEQGDEERECR
jgi:hypothetical protein